MTRRNKVVLEHNRACMGKFCQATNLAVIEGLPSKRVDVREVQFNGRPVGGIDEGLLNSFM